MSRGAGCCSCPRRQGQLTYGTHRVPTPSRCDVEHARYYGDDLGELDEIELTAELIAATGGLARIPVGRHVVAREWLVQRHSRLHRALRGLQTALAGDSAA
jgi:hypothetical protein